jgi:hypothetical protein
MKTRLRRKTKKNLKQHNIRLKDKRIEQKLKERERAKRNNNKEH